MNYAISSRVVNTQQSTAVRCYYLYTVHTAHLNHTNRITNWNKKLSYCLETVRRESVPKIAEMDVEMTT